MQAGDLLSVAQVRHTLGKAAYLRQIGDYKLAKNALTTVRALTTSIYCFNFLRHF